MSLCIFMHLCIYARTWQLSWPWLHIDKEHTAAVDPTDSEMVTWPAGWPFPSWLPVVGADKLDRGNKGSEVEVV